MTTVASGEQVLPMPDIPGFVPGIVSLDPPALQCGDCGLIWAAESDRHGLALTVILSGCSGWGFCGACTRASKGPHVRRCGDCNKAHRATHPERWQ